MNIEHIAIWTLDIEKMKAFYMKFFDVESNEKYFNPTKQFSSYFLSFENGARIELMHRPDVAHQRELRFENPLIVHCHFSC